MLALPAISIWGFPPSIIGSMVGTEDTTHDSQKFLFLAGVAQGHHLLKISKVV